MGIGLTLGAFAEGFAGGHGMKQSRKDKDAEFEQRDRLLDILEANPSLAGGGMGAVPSDGGATPARSTAYGDNPSIWNLLDAHEGAGDYDTLYGHAQRDGGKFAGTKITGMTLGDVYNFADPSGAYGQYVKGQEGHVATPMGRYQFVGTTLRDVATDMGLDPTTPFNKDTQDAIFKHHMTNTIAGKADPAEKREAMRSQWVGLKHAPDSAVDAAIRNFEATGPGLGARRPAY